MILHPPLGLLTRKCFRSTVLHVENIVVDEETQIQIPTYAIHQDPKYYPNPKIFDPERFTPDAKQQRPNNTYLYGKGNRMCLGYTFL